MMDKYFLVGGKSYYAEMLQSSGMSNGFCKTAAKIPDVLKQEIEKVKPQKDKVFLIIAPLGMGEFWGPNVNGDFFPEKGLRNETDEYGHKTFLSANLFRHHINKNPEIGFGRPIFSAIDEPQKRVITITEVDVPRAKKFGALEFLEMLAKGELPDVSMGCRVPFDTCSICGNKAKTPAQYCEHLKPGNILSYDSTTGKIACAINDFPKFFDLSFVHKGADRSSGTIYKISGDLGDSLFKDNDFVVGCNDIFSKAASEEMEKAAGFSESFFELPLEDNFLQENDLWNRPKVPRWTLDKFAFETPQEIFGSCFAAGVPLRADEIQYIALSQSGLKKMAVELYDNDELLSFSLEEELEKTAADNSFKMSKFSYEVARDIFRYRNIYNNRPMKREFLIKEAMPKINDIKAAGLFFGILAGLSMVFDKKELNKSLQDNPRYWMGYAPTMQDIQDYDKTNAGRDWRKNYPTELMPWSGLSSVPPRYGHPYNLVDGIMPTMHKVERPQEKNSGDLEYVKRAVDCVKKSCLLSLYSFFKKMR